MLKCLCDKSLLIPSLAVLHPKLIWLTSSFAVPAHWPVGQWDSHSVHSHCVQGRVSILHVKPMMPIVSTILQVSHHYRLQCSSDEGLHSQGSEISSSHSQTDLSWAFACFTHLDQLVCVFAMCSGIPTSLPVYQKIQYTFVKLDAQGWVVSVASIPLHQNVLTWCTDLVPTCSKFVLT